jgi:hypothetical protein
MFMAGSRKPPASMRRERLARRARWLLGALAVGAILFRLAQMFR